MIDRTPIRQNNDRFQAKKFKHVHIRIHIQNRRKLIPNSYLVHVYRGQHNGVPQKEPTNRV